MRVLLITPGFNKLFNDNAFSYIHMSENGVKICVISNRLRRTKGHGSAKSYEFVDGIEIHRVYKDFKEQISLFNKKISEVRKVVTAFRPDIILCSQQFNMALAVRLKREFGIPILLMVEFGYDKYNPFRLTEKERFIRNRKLGAIIAKIYWIWLSKVSDAIVTCNPNDAKNLPMLRKYNRNVFFVSWPSFPTNNSSEMAKRYQRGIFIGALDRHKNIPEFNETLPKIFSNQRIEEFYIVGQGNHLNIVNRLKEKFKGKLIHIPKVTRNEALKLISESFFAYVPAKYGAWGFIEDCWAMRTPIIATTNHYRFENEKDSIICKKEEIGNAVQAICEDAALYKNIQNGGYKRFYNDHHAYKVGEKYIRILEHVINAKK